MTTGSTAPLRRTRLVPTQLAGFVAVALAVLYIIYGAPNADEGWYLYSGRLVLDGEVPYKDFMFTQGPLLPYIYGLPQKVLPGLYTGRATAALFGVASVVVAVHVVWRRHGRGPALAAGALILASTSTIYGFSIARSYGIAAFFMVTSLAALLSHRPDHQRFAVAVLSAGALALVRQTGLAFAVTIFIYAIVTKKSRRAQLATIATLAIVASVFAFFVLSDPSAARYGLVDYHTSGGSLEHLSTSERIFDLVRHRIPVGVGRYPVYMSVLASAILLTVRARPGRQRGQPAVVPISLAAVCLFLLAHVPARDFALHAGYWTPAFPSLVMVAVLAIADELRSAPAPMPQLAGIAAGAAAVVTVIGVGFLPLLDFEGGPPIARMKAVAAYVDDHTASHDQVFALEAQWVAVETGLRLVPDLSVAQFSYQDMSDNEARRVHAVNASRVLRYFEEQVPATVVLTTGDRFMLERAGVLSDRKGRRGDVEAALADHYYEAQRFDDIGDQRQQVTVYLRR